MVQPNNFKEANSKINSQINVDKSVSSGIYTCWKIVTLTLEVILNFNRQ